MTDIDIYRNFDEHHTTQLALSPAPSSYWSQSVKKYRQFASLDNFINVLLKDFKEFVRVLNADNISELYPPQWEVATAVIDSIIRGDMGYFYIEFSRQSGKTYTMSFIISFLSFYLPDYAKKAWKYPNSPVCDALKRFDQGLRSGIFAPGMTQSKYAYDRIRQIIRHMNKRFGLKMKTDSQSEIVFGNGSRVQLFTASENANIEGATLDFIFVDEAQDVTDIMLKKSIFPMGAHRRATAVLIGTPSSDISGKTVFFEKIQQDGDNVFVYDWTEIAKYSETYKAFVEKNRAEYGRTIEFKCAFELFWPTEQISFTDLPQLNRLGMKDQKRCKTKMRGAHQELLSNVYVGIDIAKSPDSTVVCVAQLLDMDMDDERYNAERPYLIRILDWLELNDVTYDAQIEKIYEMFCRYSLRAVAVDSVGVGDSVFDMLMSKVRNNRVPQLTHCNWKAHKWTQYSHHDLFTQLHNEWWSNRIEYPWDGSEESNQFRHQFQLLGHEYRNGLLKCHHPQGEHDDYCSALALVVEAIGLDYFNPSKMTKRRKTTKHVKFAHNKIEMPPGSDFDMGNNNDVWRL